MAYPDNEAAIERLTTEQLAALAWQVRDGTEMTARKAVAALQNHPDRLSSCLAALSVDVPAALVLDRLKRIDPFLSRWSY